MITRDRKFRVNGEILTVLEIQDKYKIPAITLYKRISRGARGAEIVRPLRETKTKPGSKSRMVTYKGKRMTVSEASLKSGVRASTLWRRYLAFKGDPLKMKMIDKTTEEIKDAFHYDGKTYSQKKLSEKAGLPWSVIRRNIREGKFDIKTCKVVGKVEVKKYRYGRRWVTMAEAMKLSGLPKSTIIYRSNKNISLKKDKGVGNGK